MARLKQTLFALAFIGVGLTASLGLQGCGLGRDSGGDGRGVSDPIVAATVNGRPIYVEDVRSYAVQRGLLQEGQDLDANSDAFYFALEELIQIRLFSMEAEARGIDRAAATRRQLENARERVLANAIYDEIDERATNPSEIERLYRENASRLGQGQEIHLRHMQFASREEADAAKRRLDNGERFEALAFELSTDRDTAPDGGDLGFRAVGDLAPAIRDATSNVNVGATLGPLQVENTWQIVRIEDRRERGVPSLEQLRPRIIEWLRFQEISQLQDRLERDARIERLREPDQSQAHEPSGEVTAPADATPERPASTPDATAPPGSAPPPFPFPMGPGGVTGAPAQTPAQQPATQPPAPRPAAPRPAAPAQTPAQTPTQPPATQGTTP